MYENDKQPNPSGEDFYKLFQKVLGKGIKNYPLLNIRTMNNDNTLYVALVSFASGRIGMLREQLKNNEDLRKSIQNATDFIESEPMTALKNDTFGSYYENQSRRICYRWVAKVSGIEVEQHE